MIVIIAVASHSGRCCSMSASQPSLVRRDQAPTKTLDHLGPLAWLQALLSIVKDLKNGVPIQKTARPECGPSRGKQSDDLAIPLGDQPAHRFGNSCGTPHLSSPWFSWLMLHRTIA